MTQYEPNEREEIRRQEWSSRPIISGGLSVVILVVAVMTLTAATSRHWWGWVTDDDSKDVMTVTVCDDSLSQMDTTKKLPEETWRSQQGSYPPPPGVYEATLNYWGNGYNVELVKDASC